MKELLFELCSFDGVSGSEGRVLDLISEKVLPYADKVYFDRLGNLICQKRGKERPVRKVAFAAHADEVGLMVKHIEKDGTLLFDAIGILPLALCAKRVLVGDKKIPGVIGTKPIHLLPKEQRSKNVSAGDLYIDIGAENAENALQYVKVGDAVSFDSDVLSLSQNVIKAKAIDDRAGCAVLIELMKSELSYDAYFIFTRREELGTLGAICAANAILPDICVVCEATTASDIYGTPDMKKVTKTGEGAAVPFMDGGTLYNRELYSLATRLADEKGIKWQTKTMVAGGTDARSFQREGHGCAVLGVAVPTRYIHTGASLCDMRDILAARELVFALEKVLGGMGNA